MSHWNFGWPKPFTITQLHDHVAENSDIMENILSIAEAEYVVEKTNIILADNGVNSDVLEYVAYVQRNAIASLEFHLKTWIGLSWAVWELLLPVKDISDAHKEHLDHISDEEKWNLMEAYSHENYPTNRVIKSTAESIKLILWFSG